MLGLQVPADGGSERDVVHRLNEEYKACRVLKIAEQWRIGMNMKE